MEPVNVCNRKPAKSICMGKCGSFDVKYREIINDGINFFKLPKKSVFADSIGKSLCFSN